MAAAWQSTGLFGVTTFKQAQQYAIACNLPHLPGPQACQIRSSRPLHGQRTIRYPSFCVQAYYSAAKRFHPDKAAAAGLTPEEAEARFRDLAEAYEVFTGSLPHALLLLHSPPAMLVLPHRAYKCSMGCACSISLSEMMLHVACLCAEVRQGQRALLMSCCMATGLVCLAPGLCCRKAGRWAMAGAVRAGEACGV